MKLKINFISIAVFLFPLFTSRFFSLEAFAQEIAAVSSESPQLSPEEEWQQIRAIKPIYEEAAKSGNWDLLAPYLSRDFSLAAVTGEALKGIEGIKNYDKQIRDRIGKGGTYSLAATYDPGSLFGNVAVAHGNTAEEVVTSENTHYKFNSLWTAVLTKEDGKWKLFRLHVSMNPVDNAFVNMFRLRAVQAYALGALVVGILFGFILRGLTRKR